ncbi:MAG: hypothetical protein LUC89_05760 [Oscillospiraceae bacterium]|nr:hypothetical protein [Oscillospiraceae bacterium]
MAVCVNCRKEIVGDMSPTLIGSSDHMCTKCWGRFQQLVSKGKISLDDIDEARIKAFGFSILAIRYIRQYATEKAMTPEEQQNLQDEIDRAKQERLEAEAANRALIQAQEVESARKQAERDKLDAAKAARMELHGMDYLRASGADGYYEYKAVSLAESKGSWTQSSKMVDVGAMTKYLNEFGLDGWKLVCAYSNEIDRDALHVGFGIEAGSVHTETILIFERYVKL